jgi:hypothetical protein
MDRSVGAAARLPQSDREELAIQALARAEPVSDLAVRHGVSRKFVYAQKHKARRCFSRPRGGPALSTTSRTCQAFLSACTTRSSRA